MDDEKEITIIMADATHVREITIIMADATHVRDLIPTWIWIIINVVQEVIGILSQPSCRKIPFPRVVRNRTLMIQPWGVVLVLPPLILKFIELQVGLYVLFLNNFFLTRYSQGL